MSATLIAAIPPQPQCHRKYPFHINTTGQRIAYGCANGVVVRVLPDQVTFQHSPVETYLGSKKPITCATVSRDSKFVVAGDVDGNCHIWTRSRTGTALKVVKLDQLEYVRLTDVAVSPDSQRIAIVGIDRYSKRLAATLSTDGIPLGSITGPHTRGMTACQFLPSKPYTIMTAGLDGKICLFDGPPYKLKHSVDAHDYPIQAARFCPDSSCIVAVGDKGIISLWTYPSLELIDDYQVEGEESQLFDISWSPKGSHFVVADGMSRKLRVFSRELQVVQWIDAGKVVEDRPQGVAWSSQGWIVSACEGGHVKGWKLPSDQIVEDVAALERELSEYVQRQQAEDDEASSRPDSSRSSARSSIGLSRVADSKLLHPDADFVWYGPRGNPTAVAFDASNGVIMVGTTLGLVMFLSTSQTVPVAFQVSRLDRDVTVKSCVLSAQCGAAVTTDGCLRIYRVRTVNVGEVRAAVEAYTGSTVYASATTQEFVLAATGQVDKVPLKLVFIDDHKFIAVFCTDGSISVFSVDKALETGGDNFLPAWSVTLLGRPTCLCATPDGSLLAVALWPGEEYPTNMGEGETIDTSKPLIELYEIDSGESLEGFRFICVLNDFETEITSISLNSEGSLLACAATTREVRVVEIETKANLISREWNYHTTKVTALDWSPDGTKLVSASTNEIFIWDIDCPYSSIPIKDTSGSVVATKFIFNNIVLSASGDGIMRVYELDFH